MRFSAASFCFVVLALPAAAQDLPPRKPGQWEVSVTTTIQSQVSPRQVARYCLDATTDAALRSHATSQFMSKCDRRDWRREGRALVLHAGCKVGDQPIKVFGEATGNLETDYTTKILITRIGRPEWPTMPPETTVTSVGKWLGDCPAGQKPGDMTLPDGTLTNMRSIPGMASLLEPRPAPAAAAPAEPVANLPRRKEGVWEVRSIFGRDALPPQVQKQCVNAELDSEMIMASSSNPSENCTQTIERDGHTYLLAGKCAGEHTTLARAIISGDFQKSLTAQITIKRDDGEPLGPGLPNQIAARQDQRWLSACTADMQPGDIVMSDGTKKNIRAMRKVN